MYIGLRGKYQLFLSNFKENWIFSTDIHVTNVMKISSFGDKSSHADRRTDITDMTKLLVAFRNFANAPKNAY
jgi:hypothetical protein